VETALSQAGIGPNVAQRPEWLQIADEVRGPQLTRSAVERATTEAVRERFFEIPNGSEDLRTWGAINELTPSPEQQALLGYIVEADLNRWVQTTRFPFQQSAPASATRLERYGSCPAKFFYQDVLRLKPDEETEEEMNALAKGQLLHETLERLFNALESEGIRNVEGHFRQNPDAFRALIVESVHASMEVLRDSAHFGHPVLARIGREAVIETIVDALDKAFEKGLLPPGLPLANEMKFGEGGAPAISIDLGDGVGRIYLRGRIDRVDLTDDGELWITDYKLGSKLSYRKKLLPPGLHRQFFQLSIYALAGLEIHGTRAKSGVLVQYLPFSEVGELQMGWDQLGGLFRDIDGAGANPFLSKPPETPTLKEGLSALFRSMRSGVFSPATRGCEYCDFHAICRVPQRIRNGVWGS
ncbi:MAG: PD-(D/E)XK nuclease family protein, partial [Myxococcales bacterium]|nr:PD-(D/E)XK nuclease family protein [Myxococcales bacterium]